MLGVAAAFAKAAVCGAGFRVASTGARRVPKLHIAGSHRWATSSPAPPPGDAHGRQVPLPPGRRGSRFRTGAVRSALCAVGARAHTTLEADGVAASAAPESPVGLGEIHVIMGPMFAGKTTALLERVALAEADGLSVVGRRRFTVPNPR